MCNLRGGIGKTTLFYDSNYYAGQQTNVKDMLLPYLVPGLGKATCVASYIGATNPYFSDKNNYYIPSSNELYLLLSQLIIPVRTDQQSIKSLELLINTLSSPQSEFRKYLSETDMNVPKIQMVVLTHCGWSTVAGARNEPNQQTKFI